MNGILSLYGFEFIPTKDIGHLVLFTICLFIPSFFILYLSVSNFTRISEQYIKINLLTLLIYSRIKQSKKKIKK